MSPFQHAVVCLFGFFVAFSPRMTGAKETLIVNTVDPNIEAERILNDQDWRCIIFDPSAFVVDRAFFTREILPKIERAAVVEMDPRACCVLATIRFNSVCGPSTPDEVLDLLSAVPKLRRTMDVELNLLLVRARIDGKDSVAALQMQDEIERLAAKGHPISQYIVALAEASNAETRPASRLSLQRLSATDYDLPKLTYFYFLRDDKWNGGLVDLAASLEFCEAEVMAGNECFYWDWPDLLLQAGRHEQRTEWIEDAVRRKNVIALRIRSTELLREGRTQEAMVLTRIGADLGDPTLQFVFAQSLHTGHGVKVDFALAQRYFELSGDNGRAEAYRELGEMTRDGEGCEPDLDKARFWWRKAAALGDAMSKDGLEAIDLFAEAQSLSRSGRLSNAIEKQERGLFVLKGILGDADSTVHFQTYQLGSMLVAQGRLEEGIDLLTKLLQSVLAKDQADREAILAIRSMLGTAFVNARRYEEADETFLATLEEAKSVYGHDSVEYAKCAIIAASGFQQLGNLEKAEAVYRDVVFVCEKLPDYPADMLAGAHKTLAVVLMERNKNAEARLELERSIEVCKTGGESTQEMLAICQYSLAMLQHGQADFVTAGELYQAAIAGFRELAPDGSMNCAKAISAYAELLISQGKRRDGMASVFESVDMATKFREESWTDFAEILRLASTGAFWCGRYEFGMHCAKESVTLLKSLAGENDPSTGRAIYNVRLMAMFLGDDSAEDSFRSAIQILDKSLLSADQDLADANAGVGIFFASNENSSEALRYFDQCIRGTCQRFNVVLPGLPQPEQELYVDFNMQKLAPVWSFALANYESVEVARASAEWLTNYKWLGYESLARQVKLQRSTQNPMAQRLIELRNEIAQLAMHVPLAAQRDEHRGQYQALTQQIDTLTRKLAVEEGYSQSTSSWVTLADLQRNIPENAVFIDILRFAPSRFDTTTKQVVTSPARYVAWVVRADKDRSVAVIDLGQADQIDAQITEFRSQLQPTLDRKEISRLGGEETVATALNLKLRVLATQIYEPLAPYLGGVEELIISPDRNLWLLPWAALPINGDDTVVLEKFTIRFVSCGRQLTNVPIPLDGNSGPPVIVGNPDYDAVSSNEQTGRDKSSDTSVEQIKDSELRGRFWNERVEPLGGGNSEPQRIGALLKQYTQLVPNLLLGINANEQEVLKIKHPRVLYFVTHGIVLPDPSPAKTDDRVLSTLGGELSQSMKIPDPESSKLETSRNPLLRCALMLSGCNRSTAATSPAGDGVLTGLEVLGMNLHGTELAVLGVCDAVFGELRNGEGVGGLQQAFHLAGAKYVLGTQWSVDDLETRTITGLFFENLTSGASPPKALRLAQLKWLKDRRDLIGTAHPGFWSGLIISGN